MAWPCASKARRPVGTGAAHHPCPQSCLASPPLRGPGGRVPPGAHGAGMAAPCLAHGRGSGQAKGLRQKRLDTACCLAALCSGRARACCPPGRMALAWAFYGTGPGGPRARVRGLRFQADARGAHPLHARALKPARRRQRHGFKHKLPLRVHAGPPAPACGALAGAGPPAGLSGRVVKAAAGCIGRVQRPGAVARRIRAGLVDKGGVWRGRLARASRAGRACQAGRSFTRGSITAYSRSTAKLTSTTMAASSSTQLRTTIRSRLAMLWNTSRPRPGR